MLFNSMPRGSFRLSNVKCSQCCEGGQVVTSLSSNYLFLTFMSLKAGNEQEVIKSFSVTQMGPGTEILLT